MRGVRVSHIWWQRWDPLPAGRRQGPLVDAVAASEQSSVEARATADVRVRVAKRATAAEEEREGQQETCRESVSRQESEGRYWSSSARERGALSGPESLPVRARIAEVARVAVARAGEVQELIPCTQRGGMYCRALPEGACVAWHPECLFYTVYRRVAGRMDRRLLKGA